MSINTVVVGFGEAQNLVTTGRGRYHCNTIKTIAGLTLYGVCDIDPIRRAQAKQLYHVNTFADMDEVLDDDAVDLVIIATPNGTHMPLAIKALNAGKHVVTEKVMCLSLDEADAMIQASKQNDRLLTVYQNRRWDSDYLTVDQILRDGELGEIFQINSTITLYGMYRKPNGWRGIKEQGGGFLYDWGAHLFDQVVLLTDADPDVVFATIRYNGQDHDLETHAHVVTTFTNGLITDVEVSTISWIGRPRWHVRGERGSLIHDGTGFHLKTVAGERDLAYAYENHNGKETMHEYYRNLVAALTDGVPLFVQPEEVRKSVAIIEAAFQANERKKTVRLAERLARSHTRVSDLTNSVG